MNSTERSDVLRRAQEQDLEQINEIYNDVVLNSVATFDTEIKSMASRLLWFKNRSSRHPIFVALISGEVAGWASLNLWSERQAYAATVENSVYIRPGFQGRGLGKKLLAALLEVGAHEGVRLVLARIADGNAASLALHKKLGFEMVGVLKGAGFKFNRYIDVHMMQKTLSGDTT